MNQDKDNVLVLRVENDPPVKVKRVASPEPSMPPEWNPAQYQRRLQALLAQAEQQATGPFGRTIFGGSG